MLIPHEIFCVLFIKILIYEYNISFCASGFQVPSCFCLTDWCGYFACIFMSEISWGLCFSTYRVITCRTCKNPHQYSLEISYYDPCHHNICMGVDDLWRVLCEGRKVSYVCEAPQSNNRGTSVDERDSSSPSLFSGWVRENTYFYVLLARLGEMVWCDVATQFP